MTEEERRKFEMMLKKFGLNDDRKELELVIVGSIEDVDDDTIRRAFTVIMGGFEGNEGAG